MTPQAFSEDSNAQDCSKSTGMASNAQQSSADLIAIFDVVDVPMVIVGVNCAVTRFNRAAAALLRLTPADIGKNLGHLHLLSDQPNIVELCARVMAEGAPLRCDLQNEERRLLLRIAAYPGGTRPTMGAVLTLTNVTAQRASIEQAIYEREFTKTILNTIMEPLIVLNAELRVQAANRAFYTMFNVSREEASDRLLTELKHHTWDAQELWTYLRNAQSLTSPSTLEFNHDFPRLGRRTMLAKARPLLVDDGATPMVLLVLADITERKQAHEALRASESRFRTLFESMEEGYCVIEMIFDDQNHPIDYRFLEVNPAFEKQTGIVSAKGRLMREIAPTHEQYWFDIYGRIALTGETARFENHAAALHRWYEVNAFRVGPAELRRVGTVFNDISGRKQSEDALRHLNSELESRVQVRTRELTQSQERLRALAADLNLAEQRERQRLAADLHDYLGQLLALSLIKLSQAKLQPMEATLGKIFGEVVEITDKALAYTRTLVAQLCPPLLHEFGLSAALRWLAEQMHQRNLSVSVNLRTELPPIPEDQALLIFQSVRELLINCIKHAGTHEAAIVLERIGESLHITVSDHGTGFDLLFVATSAQAHPHTPGFGLFSIRERMLSIGGRLDLKTAPGLGTSAILVVPLTGAVADVSSGHAQGRSTKARNETLSMQYSNSHNGSKVRVLIADDHTMMRQGLSSLLDHYSEIQVVGEAANGEEAVALAEQLQPDVILMDVTMPKMDGIEATKLIKRIRPDVVVIGLSVHTSEQVGRAMTEAGVAAIINKEAASDELYQTIHAARESTGSRPLGATTQPTVI